MTAMVVLGFYESLTFAVIAALGRPPSFFRVLISVQAAGSILGGLATAPHIRRTGEARTLGARHAAWSAASLVYTIRSVPTACTALAPLYAAALGTTSQRFTPPRLQGRTGAATTMLTNLSQTLSIAAGAALIAVAWLPVAAGRRHRGHRRGCPARAAPPGQDPGLLPHGASPHVTGGRMLTCLSLSACQRGSGSRGTRCRLMTAGRRPASGRRGSTRP